MLPISAAEYDRAAESGKAGRYDKFFRPITSAEFARDLEKSRRAG